MCYIKIGLYIMKLLVLTIIIVIWVAVTVHADVIHLNNGNILKGTVEYTENSVNVTLGLGLTLSFPFQDIFEIESDAEVVGDATSASIALPDSIKEATAPVPSVTGTVEIPTPVPFFLRREPKNVIPEVDWTAEIPEVYSREQIQEAKLREIPSIYVKGKIFVLQPDGEYVVENYKQILRKEMEKEELYNFISDVVVEVTDELGQQMDNSAYNESGDTLYYPENEPLLKQRKRWSDMNEEEKSEELRKIYAPQLQGNMITLPEGSSYYQIQLPNNQ